MIYPIKRAKKAFTLIEILIYTTLVAIFLVTAVNFSLDIIAGKAKARSMREVQQNTRFTIERMTQEIRRAVNLNLAESVFDAHPGILSLAMPEAEKNPTVFDLSLDGALRMTQGTSTPEILFSNQVAATNLVFTNLSPLAWSKNIKINLTVQYKNPERKEFEATSIIETAVSLRK